MASVFGTSTVATTSVGIFGLFATTTIAAVAAALGYGAYKRANSSAKDRDKEE